VLSLDKGQTSPGLITCSFSIRLSMGPVKESSGKLLLKADTPCNTSMFLAVTASCLFALHGCECSSSSIGRP
jgi:hypothetical protein